MHLIHRHCTEYDGERSSCVRNASLSQGLHYDTCFYNCFRNIGKSSFFFLCVRCDRQAKRKTVRYVTTAAGTLGLLAFFSVVTVKGLSIACRQKLRSAMFYQDPDKSERQNSTCACREHMWGGRCSSMHSQQR